MENPVIIFGAGNLGRAAKDIFDGNGVVVYGFLDDDKKLIGQELDDVVILGNMDDENFLKVIGKKCEAFIAIDDNKIRKHLADRIVEEYRTQPVNAIHRAAVISVRSELGHGNFIDAGVRIAAGVKLASHSIFHANAVVGVETTIGNFVQIGAGSIVNNGVRVEDDVFIGSGVTIISGVTVGKNARIGAGSVVIADVKASATIFGNPAQAVKS